MLMRDAVKDDAKAEWKKDANDAERDRCAETKKDASRYENAAVINGCLNEGRDSKCGWEYHPRTEESVSVEEPLRTERAKQQNRNRDEGRQEKEQLVPARSAGSGRCLGSAELVAAIAKPRSVGDLFCAFWASDHRMRVATSNW